MASTFSQDLAGEWLALSGKSGVHKHTSSPILPFHTPCNISDTSNKDVLLTQHEHYSELPSKKELMWKVLAHNTKTDIVQVTLTTSRSFVWPQHLAGERKCVRVVRHLRTMATVSVQLRPLTHSNQEHRKQSQHHGRPRPEHWPPWHCPCILLLSALLLSVCLSPHVPASSLTLGLFSLSFISINSQLFIPPLQRKGCTMKNLCP